MVISLPFACWYRALGLVTNSGGSEKRVKRIESSKLLISKMYGLQDTFS